MRAPSWIAGQRKVDIDIERSEAMTGPSRGAQRQTAGRRNWPPARRTVQRPRFGVWDRAEAAADLAAFEDRGFARTLLAAEAARALVCRVFRAIFITSFRASLHSGTLRCSAAWVRIPHEHLVCLERRACQPGVRR